MVGDQETEDEWANSHLEILTRAFSNPRIERKHWIYLVWLPTWFIFPPQSCYQTQLAGRDLEQNNDVNRTVLFFSLPKQALLAPGTDQIDLADFGVITMKQSPYSSPLNWMEQEGKFSQSFDVGHLMNQILTRLGAELSWIPEGNKRDFIQWKSIYALECIL